MSLCLKRPYTSVRQARERTQTLGNRTRVYVCDVCGAFHVTDAEKHPPHEQDYVMPSTRRRIKRRPERAPQRAAKLASKERDGWRCRWNVARHVEGIAHAIREDCHVQGRGLVHSAHLVASGMGGRPSVSDKPSDYVTLCPAHHALLDAHKVDAVVTEAGGDGPVEFRPRVPHNAR